MQPKKRYVRDILAKTPKDRDQVTITPDGRWHTSDGGAKKAAAKSANRSASYVADDEDDSTDEGKSIVNVMNDVSGTAQNRNLQSVGATANWSAAPEAESSAPRASSSNKRPVSEVIDLTLDDDDDESDGEQPPSKRPNYGGASRGPFRPEAYSNS